MTSKQESDKKIEETETETKEAPEDTGMKADDAEVVDEENDNAKGDEDGAAAEVGKDEGEGDEGAQMDEEKKDEGEGDGMAESGAAAAAGEEKHEDPEAAKELEEDATEDSRPKLAPGSVEVRPCDASLNVMPTSGGKVLMTLTDLGFQHFVAAARASVGLRAGRYFYEVRIVEGRAINDSGFGRGPTPPRHVLRVGFSTLNSSLFLREGDHYVAFDAVDGSFLADSKRSKVCRAARPTQYVLGVLLNLDPSSPNANTLSLFRDGVRASPPQTLPEALHGKALFPTVNFKGLVLHMNYGTSPMAALPFKCRTVQEAAKADIELAPALPTQCKVIFPIGLPDEGTFDWLDGFLKENPEFSELSDRAVLEWARLSEIPRPKGYGWKNCNDRPGYDFGVRELDDLSVRHLITAVAPLMRRSLIVMEVRCNLLEADRKRMLTHFPSTDFERIAMVMVGEPPEAFKTTVREQLLAHKKEKAAAEVRRKKALQDRPRAVPQDEDKDKEKEAEPEESVEDAVKKAEAEVELTPEEEKAWFRKPVIEDLTRKELGHVFASFTLPKESDGFDKVAFEWQKEAGAAEYMKRWMCEKKLTQRVEDLQPGSWFRDLSSEWHRLLQDWRRRQQDVDPARRRLEADKRRKATAPPKELKEPKDGHEEAKETAKENVEGEEKNDEGEEQAEKEEKAPDENEESKRDEESKKDEDVPMDIDVDELDVYSVEDILDIGNGDPLFANFAYEDWALLGLRFDMHALVHAFRKDLDDPERTSFHESHLQFYYHKYFRKQLTPKNFGVSTVLELLDLIKDSVTASSDKGILETHLSDDTPLENFVKLTEDGRRERELRIDAGEESAVLKFIRGPPESSRGGYDSGPKGKGSSRQGFHGQPQNYLPPTSARSGSYGGGGGRGPPPPPVGGSGGRGPPPASRMPPGRSGPAAPVGGSSRGGRDGYSSRDHGSGRDSGYGGRDSGYGGRDGGRDSRGAPPQRGYGSAPAASNRGYSSGPPPPPPRGGPSGPGSYSGQRRPHDGPNGAPPNKQARTSYSSGPPARGGSSHGGSSRGYSGSGGSGYGRR